MKKIINNKTLLSFLFSLILGCFIIVPNIIVGKGIYYLVNDFNLQQIPFNMINNYSIKNGEIFFTWFNDFGSNFISTYSFYNLFSPFNIIGYLFPSGFYPYLIGPIFILKYGISGLTSYLYLKRYVKNKNYALLGSLIYTFSGFQFVNTMYYHFHDVVCFFPLLLYSLDNLVLDNKKGRFLFVVALCSLTNWFFFIEEVIFLVLYYIIKIITKEYKFTLNNFITIVIEGILGTFITMFMLLPTFLFTMSNSRLQSVWTFSKAIKYSSIWYLELIRAFILPSQTMSLESRALLLTSNYSSIDMYLPLVSVIFVLSYMIHNRKKSSTLLIIISMIIMIFPILNSIFVLFNSTFYYFRWIFMPILIMSLMTIKSIEDKHSIKFSSLTVLVCNILFLIILIIKRNTLIHNNLYVLIMFITSFISIFICMFINNKKNRLKYYFIFVSLFIILYGNFMVIQYKYSYAWSNNEFRRYIKYSDNYNLISDGRSNSSSSCVGNLGNTKRIHNIRSFNSNISGSVFEFFNSIDNPREMYTAVDVKDKKLNDFLGVKYIIACDDENMEDYGYKYYNDIDGYKIYINDKYKNFGSSYSNYISDYEFKKLDSNSKIDVLNENVVLNKKQINKYGKLYPNNVSYEKNEFKFIKNGFSSYIVSSDETIALFQIPYDSGWKATINGIDAEIENIDNGFIGIKINKGSNNIIFKYEVPGLKFGIVISIISLISSGIYIFIFKK
jgi:uncharacterized membrane protein YfhO